MRRGTHRLLAFLLCGTMVFSGLSSAAVYAEDGQAQNEIAEVQGEDTNAAQGEAEDITAKGETSEELAANSSEGLTSEETNADEILRTASLGGEGVPVAAAVPPLPSEDQIKMGYREKQAAFVPTDKMNVITVQMNSLSSSQIKSLFDSNPECSLKGPNGENISMEGAERGYNQNGLVLLWWSLPQRLTQEGKYTFTLKADGQEVSLDFSLVKVTFRAGSEGKFPGGKDTYEGFTSQRAGETILISNFAVPTPTRESDTEEFKGFIGWAKQSGVEAFTKDNPEVTKFGYGSGSSYEVYAAYGQQRLKRYQTQKGSGSGQAGIDSLDFGEVPYGKPVSQTVYVRNTGTETFKDLTMYMTVSDDFEFTLQKGGEELKGLSAANFASGEELKLTITVPATMSMGVHRAELQFSGDSGYKNRLVITANVKPDTVTITPKACTKEFGKVLTSSDVKFEISTFGTVQNVTPEELGVTLTSDGFTAGARPGTYEYRIIESESRDYKVELASDYPKLEVKKAVPEEKSMSATNIRVGAKLSTSVLTGSFVNPWQKDWTVPGDLTWEDGSQSWNTEGTQTCRWTFTPQDTEAYKIISGEVSVNVKNKEATTITRTSAATTFEYDGKGHGLEFTTSRQEQTEVLVKYRPAGSRNEGDWTEAQPVEPGTYEVQASVAESSDYAEHSIEDSLTIEPRTVSVLSYGAAGKTYDGNTNAKANVTLTNLVRGENVGVEFTAAFENKDAGSRNVAITLTKLTGDEKTLSHYKLPEKLTYHTTAMIIPVVLELKPAKLTKVYGETRTLNPSDFTIEGLVSGETIPIEFFCDGTGPEAEAGVYEITAYLRAGGNYKVKEQTVKAGTLTVNRAVPETAAIKPGAGYKGGSLGKVALTGEFVNPYTRYPVDGTLEWANPEVTLPTTENTYNAEWKFTPKDTKNYEETVITGQAEIPLLEKEPIRMNVSNAVVTYDGKPHGIETPTLAADENVRPEDISIQVEYKEHKDIVTLAAVNLLEAGHDDYSVEEPVEAGTYDVHVHVYVADSIAETRSNTLVEATLEILPRTPDAPGQQTVEVPQGTVLTGDLGGQVKRPVGVDGQELAGTFSWETEGISVEAEGAYQWTFVPDSKNYGPVSGWLTLKLQADTRTIDAKVYNLPDGLGLGYEDYAVVYLGEGENALRLGEQITFYEQADCQNPESETVTIAEDNIKTASDGRKYVIVTLDGDALADNDGVIYARITSSVKHEAQPVSYERQVDIEVPSDTVEVYVDYDTELTVKVLGNYTPEYISFVANSGDPIEIKEKDGAPLTRNLHGLRLGEADISVTLAFQHPDQENHPGKLITLKKTVHVVVKIHPGDVTVKVESESGAPDVEIPSVEQLKDQVLESADMNRIEQGVTVNVELTVKNIDNAVPALDKNAAEQCASRSDYTVGEYLDISLHKTFSDDGSSVPIYETNAPITLTISVPENLKAAWRVFEIIRVHDNKAEVLEDLDKNQDTITIATDRFSTYAIAYRDPLGSLTVTNKVTGIGDKSKAFTFTVTLEDKSINGKHGGMEFTNGSAQFVLKHGESMTAENLPGGMSYTVVETEANKDGYTTSAEGASGTIMDGRTAWAVFTNNKDKAVAGGNSDSGDKASSKASPQTGDNNHIVMWSVLMITSLLCAVVTVMFSIRRRSRIRVMRRRRRR